ncbi:CbtB domain-containing protein [Streptomyces sp. NPDC003697]
MAQSVAQPTTTPTAVPAKLPIGAIAPWAVLFGILTLVLLYFVGVEQSATSVMNGEDVHEWVHDARHLLGFPCH